LLDEFVVGLGAVGQTTLGLGGLLVQPLHLSLHHVERDGIGVVGA
jgi:hypothetical protein